MKRYLVYIVALVLAAGVSPFYASDVGQLQPVEAVSVFIREGSVQVATDTGELGVGNDLPAALRDLHNTSPKHIFLDTAEYLLLSPGTEFLIPRLEEYFRPSCGVCLADGVTDLALAAEFLDAHGDLATLADHRAEELPIPTLKQREERMHLE